MVNNDVLGSGEIEMDLGNFLEGDEQKAAIEQEQQPDEEECKC